MLFAGQSRVLALGSKAHFKAGSASLIPGFSKLFISPKREGSWPCGCPLFLPSGSPQNWLCTLLQTLQQAGEELGPKPGPKSQQSTADGAGSKPRLLLGVVGRTAADLPGDVMRGIAEGNCKVAFRRGMRSHLERVQGEI